MKRVVVNIFGKVQMVGFRHSIRQKSKELNITGFVENLRDGSVEAQVQGEEAQIEKFISWSKVGPPYAKVVKIITEDMEVIPDEKDFKIL